MGVVPVYWYNIISWKNISNIFASSVRTGVVNHACLIQGSKAKVPIPEEASWKSDLTKVWVDVQLRLTHATAGSIRSTTSQFGYMYDNHVDIVEY